MSWFDEFDWGGLVKNVGGAVIQAAPSIYAANAGANKVVAGNQQAANIATDAGARNEALIREQMARSAAAVDRSGALVGRAGAAVAPALAHFRTTMSRDPSELTPEQQIAIRDSQRELAGRNLIGTVGGRAMSKMMADTTGRLRASAVQQNAQRGDAAASQVGSLGLQTTGQDLQATGQQMQATQMVGQGTNALVTNNSDVATNVGNAVTSSANATAEPYGAIANMFANSMKDADRKSRYEEYKTSRA